VSVLECDLQLCNPDTKQFEHGVYECRVWLRPEPEGGYSAIGPFLPGVVSQGASEQEAIENVREAFQGALAEYLETEGSIPWLREPIAQKPREAKEKWILVHV